MPGSTIQVRSDRRPAAVGDLAIESGVWAAPRQARQTAGDRADGRAIL
jgi:hypothetical protein